MADGKKFDIEIGTSADLSALQDLDQSMVKITDTTRRNTEEIKRNEAAQEAWQNELEKSRRGDGDSSLAVDPAEFLREEQDAAEGAAQATRDLAREKQQLADLEEAREKVAKRAGDAEKDAAREESSASARRVGAYLLVGKLAGDLIGATSRAVSEFEKLGVEAPASVTALRDALELAKNPWDYIIDAATNYKEELRLLAQSQANAAKMEQLYLDTLKRKQDELATASRNRITNFLAAEKRAIEENTAAYERQRRVIDALADAEEARARAADAVAIANGADPNQVAAGALARQGARDNSAQDARVTAAEQALEAAQRSYEAAVYALAQGQTGTREEIAALSAAAQEAQAAVANASAEVETVKIEAAAAKGEIAAGAVAEFQDAATAAAEANTTAAAEAKAALEAEAKEQGKAFSAGGKEALKILTDALTDGVIKPEEIAAVTVAMNQIKNSQSAHNAEVLKGFATLEATLTTAKSSQVDMNRRLQTLENLYRDLPR